VALGPPELTFLISSGTMLALFIMVFYKLCKSPDVRRSHKIVYALVFPALVILGVVSIIVFQLNMDWTEALAFNVVWIPFFIFMLQDLTGNPWLRDFPFGRAILAALLTALVIAMLILILVDILSFLSGTGWFFPVPLLIFLVIAIGPLLILTTLAHQKGEEVASGGIITSGGRMILLALGLTFGTILIAMGSFSIILHTFLPLHISIPTIICGIVLILFCLPYSIRERRKRVEYYGF
jgi:hypothetical protein